MFSQGYNNINTNMLTSGPFQSGFGPKIRVVSCLRDFLFLFLDK